MHNAKGGTFYDNESPDNKFNVGNYSGGYGTSVIGNKTVRVHTQLQLLQVVHAGYAY